MKIKEVAKLSPEDRFLYWIKERHQIYMKRNAGKSKPWTDDEILQSYRFCNVRRRDDKVSKWLMDNWYAPNKDHPNMLVACTLARQLNRIDTLEEIGFPLKWNPKKIESILNDRIDNRRLKNYSAAYMITSAFGKVGKDRGPEKKSYQTIWRVCQPVFESKLEIDKTSMQSTWKMLLSFMGFSSFIAGQVVADLRHGISGSFRDKKVWAPVGPGSMRGLNRLYERDKHHKIAETQFQYELRQVSNLIKRRLSKLHKTLEAMDVQSCLCEYDKYSRILLGEGRPKQIYKGI